MTRATRTFPVRPDWVVGSWAKRLMVLTAALIVVATFRPGPAAAAAAGLALLALTFALTERVPAKVELVVGSSGLRVTAGEVVRLDVAVSAADGSTAPIFGTAALDLVPELETAGRLPWQLRLGDSPLPLTVRPRQWTYGPMGQVRLRLSTPLGGRACVASVELPSLVAHPRIEPDPDVYAPPHLLSRFGTHPGRQRGAGTEFAELRPYATGDPLRDVAWKSSARTRQLMVSQRYQDQAADVVVVVDHTSVVGGYDRRLHDRAVQGASTVARAYLRAGDRVGLVMFGSAVRWLPPGQGRAHEARILDQIVLRPIVASLLDPDLALVPPVALPTRSVVFCFSPLLDRRMLGAIARLAERGHRLIVIDSIGERPARWPTWTTEQTKSEWLRRRLLVRSRLSELGAIVIDEVGAIGVAVRGMSRAGAGR